MGMLRSNLRFAHLTIESVMRGSSIGLTHHLNGLREKDKERGVRCEGAKLMSTRLSPLGS